MEEEIPSCSRKKLIQIVIIICIGTFMSALDASIVNISLPMMSKFFNVSLTTIEWVVLSYLLIITSLLLSFGRIGDLYGHKKIYNTGFLVFVLGSLFCALSPSIIFLISARALQAIGAGMLMAMGPAIITINCPGKERGKYLGAIAVSVSVALISGPIAGGFLTSFFWLAKYILYKFAHRFFRFFLGFKGSSLNKGQETSPFDFAGAATLFFALIGIIFPLSFADKIGWKNPYIIASLVSGVFLLLLFFFIETRRKNPMLDLSLFKNRLFTMANISLLINFIAQSSVALIIPFYLIQLREFEPFKAGLLIIANPIAVMIMARLAGIISDKFDAKYLTSAGMAVSSTGLFLLGTLKTDSSIILIIIYAFIAGFGIGLFQTPNNSTIMGSVSHNRRGVASSMLATMRNLGMILGIAISGTVFSTRTNYLNKILNTNNSGPADLKSAAFIGAFRFTLITAAVISSIAIITSLFVSFNPGSVKKRLLKNN